MDLISWLLALIGIGSDRAMHRSGQRTEAARLNAEVAGEAGRTLDIITAAMPRLTRRCTQLCGEDSELCANMAKVLNEQRDGALKIIKMTGDFKRKISDAKSSADWNRIIIELQSWRANASRIAPLVQNIVDRYDEALRDAGAR